MIRNIRVIIPGRERFVVECRSLLIVLCLIQLYPESVNKDGRPAAVEYVICLGVHFLTGPLKRLRYKANVTTSSSLSVYFVC